VRYIQKEGTMNAEYKAAIQAIASKKFILAFEETIKDSQKEIDQLYNIAELNGIVSWVGRGGVITLKRSGHKDEVFEDELSSLYRIAELLSK
jgi:hypothetical protein